MAHHKVKVRSILSLFEGMQPAVFLKAVIEIGEDLNYYMRLLGRISKSGHFKYESDLPT